MISIKVLSLFSGIGAFEKALSNIGINYDLINYCEKNKFASTSYSTIHSVPETKNLGDVEKINIDTLDDFDLLTWGSPCTNFSKEGNRKGCAWSCRACGNSYNPLSHITNLTTCPQCGSRNLNKTPSSLIVYGVNIIREKHPKYSIFENVPDILTADNKLTFKLFQNLIKKAGYKNFKAILNSKNFRIPQNRERVFVVSIRNDLLNSTSSKFIFPKKRDNLIRLKSFLEDSSEVSNNYFLDNNLLIGENKLMLSAILNIKARDKLKRVYSPEGLCPTLDTMEGGNRQPKILINYGVRKLTPLECWRLMGFTDEDFNKAKQALNNTYYSGKDNSSTQLYKQAGNSIVVTILEDILNNLLKI